MWSHPPGPGHTFVVTCSIIITHILYALSGRRGFLSMELDGKINAWFRYLKWFGYINYNITVVQFLNDCNLGLFFYIQCPRHCFYHVEHMVTCETVVTTTIPVFCCVHFVQFCVTLCVYVLLCFLLCCLECMHRGLSTRKLSVRPSVKCECVDCEITEEISAQIFIPYERTFMLVFREEEWSVGATPSTWNVSSNWSGCNKIVVFSWYSLVVS